MADLRRTALAALLALALGSDVPGAAGRLVGSPTHRHGDSVRVASGHRAGRVRITGTVRWGLRPGISVPIQIGFLSPSPRPVNLRRVRVSIVGIAAPRADAAHPCTTADFWVRQMPRRSLPIPAGRYVDLAGLGMSIEDWPQLVMRNRPVNQDGCQGASLSLRYRARRWVHR